MNEPTEGNETKDSNVVRHMDGYEYGECFIWISLSDEIPVHLDLDRFRRSLDRVTEPYAAFHLGANPPMWTRLSVKPSECVFEVKWTPRTDVEPMEAVVPEGGRMWFIEVAQCPSTEASTHLTRLTLQCNHSLCDGRTMGCMFGVVLHAVLDSVDDRESLMKAAPALRSLPRLPPPCELCSFGQRDNFDGEKIPKELMNGVPASWKRSTSLDSLLPRISLPDVYVARYAEYPLSLWQRYANSAKQRGISRPSLQGALMAAEARAMRKYCGMEPNAAIITEVMYDGRRSAYATPAMREREFFCGAGAGFIEVHGKESWEDDIAACTEALIENSQLPDSVAMTLQLGSAMDPESGIFKAPDGMPSTFRDNVVVTTNIGRYDGTTSPRVGVRLPCGENYFVCQYVWNTSTTIYVMFLHPKTLDRDYVQSYYDLTDELFSFFSTA